MNGVSPHPVCQSRCCNPRASPSRTPVSANNIHSNLLRTDPRHCRVSVIPARARLTDPLDLLRRQDRWRRPARAAHPDHRLPAALAAGDVLQQRLVPAAATMGDPMQVSAHVHAVEHVIVVAGHHRAQPRGDRRLGKPGTTALDRHHLRLVPGAQPGQKRPEVLQRHRIPVQPEQLQELPPQRQRPRVGLHRVRRHLLGPKIFQVLLGRVHQTMVRAQHRPGVPPAPGQDQPLHPTTRPGRSCDRVTPAA